MIETVRIIVVIDGFLIITETAKIVIANAIKIVEVLRYGISTYPAKNVPTMLPTVENAYKFPAVLPVFSRLVRRNLIA